MFYVYAWYEPDGTCFYIGKGIGERYRRRSDRNAHWKAIAAKHDGNVTVRFLHEGLTEKRAFELERQLIVELRPRANKTSGGEGVSGYTHTAEVCEGVSERMKESWADPDQRAKMVAGNAGRQLAQEHKDLIGRAHRGMTRPPGTGEKIAATKRGKPRSEATKAKIRATLLARGKAGRSLAKSGRTTGAQ